MAGAAYQLTSTCTNAETYIETLDLLDVDGTPFADITDYTYEYSIKGCGVDLLLNEADGITVDAVNSRLTISPGVDYRFPVGNYSIGFRKTHTATGLVDQDADGTLTVTEGNF